MIELKSFTLKEAAKKINVPPGIIRQWEKDLSGLLEIPRSKQGARIYTVTEIKQLKEIKELYAKKIPKEQIRQSLIDRQNNENIPITNEIEIHVEECPLPVNELEVVSEPPPAGLELTSANTSLFFEAMDSYSKNFLNEVKEEIRSTVRKEVIEEVKKEISKGSLVTVRSISDSIYKTSANTREEIQELSHNIRKATEVTADKLHYLSSSIQNVSIETYEEISTTSFL